MIYDVSRNELVGHPEVRFILLVPGTFSTYNKISQLRYNFKFVPARGRDVWKIGSPIRKQITQTDVNDDKNITKNK